MLEGKKIADKISAYIDAKGTSKARIGEVLGVPKEAPNQSKYYRLNTFLDELRSGKVNTVYVDKIAHFYEKTRSYFTGEQLTPVEEWNSSPYGQPGKLEDVGWTVQPSEFEEVPFVGEISCGPLREAEQIDHETRPIHRSKLDKNGKYVMLIAKGFSMIDAGIQEGDEILVRLDIEPKNNDICIFSLRGEMTMGYYQKKGKFVLILKANKEYSPIPVSDEDFRIEGVAVSFFRSLQRRK